MVEERDPVASPIQAKGIGELGMCGGAAALRMLFTMPVARVCLATL